MNDETKKQLIITHVMTLLCYHLPETVSIDHLKKIQIDLQIGLDIIFDDKENTECKNIT